MIKILSIALGGALGALCRVYLSANINKYYLGVYHSLGTFPLGTFCVNLIGAFFIGFFWKMFQTFSTTTHFRFFILAGFLGALTTFSTFSLEIFHLLKNSDHLTAFSYLAMSNLFGILMVFCGYTLSAYGFRWISHVF